MDLLEDALKHSIEWSLDHQQNSSQRSTNATDIDVEQHSRAFLTRFKIELNHLMGVKWMLNNTSVLDETTTTEDDDVTGNDEQHQMIAVFPKRGNPAIKLNGKYSGVYEIGQDDEETDTESNRYEVIRMPLGADSHADDGYRSLSRGSSFGTNLTLGTNTKGTIKASVNLIQQLNDIKSRIIDLVHEIDQCAGPKLVEDDLDAYRRRRDTLLQKLESLIELHKCLSCASESDDGYEEQTQVIDYDFARRANDLAVNRKTQLDTSFI